MMKFVTQRNFFKLTTVFNCAFSILPGYGLSTGKWLKSTTLPFVVPPYLFPGLMLIVGSLLLAGCESDELHPPAPLGDLATLEKLATSYKVASADIPTNPVKMRPEARRKFLEQVFNDAGYNYSRTLLALARVDPHSITQHHTDLKELLFLPHYGVKLEEVTGIYSEEELQAIKQIDEHFK